MTHPIHATVYFDFMCPYAYRAVRLFTEMEQIRPSVCVDWLFFSMEQTNAVSRGRSEDWQIWNQPLDYEPLWRRPRSRMLLPFLAAYAAQLQGKEAFARFRLAVYQAYHDDKLDTSDPAVLLGLAHGSGLNLVEFEANWQSPAARDYLSRNHHRALDEGAFGVPTIVINECEAAYLRLSEYPEDPQERQIFFDELVHALTARPYLQELKRASAA